MNILDMGLLVTSILILFLALLQLAFSTSEQTLEANNTSVEAGFDKTWQNSFLSTPFLFLSILFVMFDMELILIITFIFFSEISVSLLSFLLMMLVLVLTLLMEWLWSKLKWQV